ncbi:MAG: hypothetical protein HY049_14235 [Acidobacteria bacterium]|nr:hypothetical protein [Acidobacteriota bacterium]
MIESYVVCVSNAGFKTALVVRKVYRALSDAEAGKRGLIRVVDESGEDYLFPATLFVPIDLPKEAARAFSAAS